MPGHNPCLRNDDSLDTCVEEQSPGFSSAAPSPDMPIHVQPGQIVCDFAFIKSENVRGKSGEKLLDVNLLQLHLLETDGGEKMIDKRGARDNKNIGSAFEDGLPEIVRH